MVKSKALPKILFHELLHAVSGRTVIKSQVVDDIEGYGEFTDTDIIHQRTGTRIGSPRGEGLEMKQRFHWLNEAVTEQLTWRLLGKKIPEPKSVMERLMSKKYEGSATYVPERKLFDLLLQKGSTPLDEKLFLAAYFEDFDPEKPNPIPAWKAMTKAVRESYGSNMLLELDKMIKSGGIGQAIKFLQERKA